MLHEFQFHYPYYVISLKSYVDGLFNLTSVAVWVTVGKLNHVPNWQVPGLVGVFQ